MTPRFTVLLPIVRAPLFLPYAIETVLAQTVAEFELFIICDGAPPETIVCGEEFASRDPRVKVLAFPKGERIGERHWHAALQQATGTYVAHLEDDDLWFPNHLEELQTLLQTADFGHTIHVWVTDKGEIEALPTDIGMPEVRERSLNGPFNHIGFSVCGYRLSAYRALPEGWAPAPVGVWPDLHMWRKFYRSKDLKFGTHMAVTALVVPTHLREDASSNRRKDENLHWYERVRDRQGRQDIIEAAWRSIVRSTVELTLSGAKIAEDLNQLRIAGDACGAELGRMTQSRDVFEAEVGRMTQSRDHFEAEVGRMTQSRDHFEAEVHRLRESRDEVMAELGRMTHSRDYFESEALRFESEARRFESEARRFESEARQFESEARQFESEARQFESEARQFESEARRFESEAHRFESEAHRLTALLADMQDERRLREILEGEVSRLRQTRDAGEAELARVTQMLAGSQAELAQTSNAFARSQASLAGLTETHTVTKAELATVLGSRSWRLTRPLRASRAMAARFRRTLRNVIRSRTR